MLKALASHEQLHLYFRVRHVFYRPNEKQPLDSGRSRILLSALLPVGGPADLVVPGRDALKKVEKPRLWVLLAFVPYDR